MLAYDLVPAPQGTSPTLAEYTAVAAMLAYEDVPFGVGIGTGVELNGLGNAGF